MWEYYTIIEFKKEMITAFSSTWKIANPDDQDQTLELAVAHFELSMHEENWTIALSPCTTRASNGEHASKWVCLCAAALVKAKNPEANFPDWNEFVNKNNLLANPLLKTKKKKTAAAKVTIQKNTLATLAQRVFDSRFPAALYAPPSACFVNAAQFVACIKEAGPIMQVFKDAIHTHSKGSFLFIWCYSISQVCAVTKSLAAIDAELFNDIVINPTGHTSSQKSKEYGVPHTGIYVLVVGSRDNQTSFVCYPGKTKAGDEEEAVEDNNVEGEGSSRRKKKPKGDPVYETALIKDVQGNVVSMTLNNGESFKVGFFTYTYLYCF